MFFHFTSLSFWSNQVKNPMLFFFRGLPCPDLDNGKCFAVWIRLIKTTIFASHRWWQFEVASLWCDKTYKRHRYDSALYRRAAWWWSIGVKGQKIWTSRAEYSDLMLLLALTTLLDQCVKKPDGLSVFLEDMREVCDKSLTITPIRTMMNHSSTQLFCWWYAHSGQQPYWRRRQGILLYFIGY